MRRKFMRRAAAVLALTLLACVLSLAQKTLSRFIFSRTSFSVSAPCSKYPGPEFLKQRAPLIKASLIHR